MSSISSYMGSRWGIIQKKWETEGIYIYIHMCWYAIAGCLLRETDARGLHPTPMAAGREILKERKGCLTRKRVEGGAVERMGGGLILEMSLPFNGKSCAWAVMSLLASRSRARSLQRVTPCQEINPTTQSFRGRIKKCMQVCQLITEENSCIPSRRSKHCVFVFQLLLDIFIHL